MLHILHCCARQAIHYSLPKVKLAGNLKFFSLRQRGSSPLRNSAKENNVTVHNHIPCKPYESKQFLYHIDRQCTGE